MADQSEKEMQDIMGMMGGSTLGREAREANSAQEHANAGGMKTPHRQAGMSDAQYLDAMWKRVDGARARAGKPALPRPGSPEYRR